MRLGQKYKNIFVGFLVQMKTFISAFEINWPLDLTNLITCCSRASGTRGARGGARSTQILGSTRSKTFSFKSTSIYFCPLPDYWTFRRHWVLPSFLWCYPSLGMLSVFAVFFDSTQFSATDSGLPYYLTANYIDILPFTLLKVAGIHRKISFRHPCTFIHFMMLKVS